MDPWYRQYMIQEKKRKMERLGKYAELEIEHVSALVREPNRETIQWRFPNGYGASVASNQLTFFAPELAVLKYTPDGTHDLCYDTGITSDVLRGVTLNEVKTLLTRIKNLKGDNDE